MSEHGQRRLDEAELAFAFYARALGWQSSFSTVDEDRHEHWDVRIGRDQQAFRVDVKQMKRIYRGDQLPQDEWHWVELRGIRDLGWLFGGKAELIAFETRWTFLIVPRMELAAFVRRHVRIEPMVDHPQAAYYRAYMRTERAPAAESESVDRGVIALVATERLRALRWAEWEFF